MDMERITLNQPKMAENEQSVLLNRYISEGLAFRAYYDEINEPKYLFWTKAMFRATPKNFTGREAWLTARLIRKFSAIPSPVQTEKQSRFTYVRLASFDRLLHNIDLQIGGQFLVSKTTTEERQKFLSRGILEEAIASSQLEGASTTRRHAKKMIAEKRKPTNTSERMIYNNYLTLSAIDEEYKDRDLSKELLLEMHVKLTANTLDEPEDVGRFRVPGDGINVIYQEKIAHIAPASEFVIAELEKLISYANDDKEFVHPLIKASILHFWLGYLHPFADGNGRLARSLFYWYLLKHGYWGIAYIPISMVIKRAKRQYAYAYIYAEQDNLDLTYFLDYSLRRINTAITEFDSYIKSLEDENRLVETKLRGIATVNDRQKQLVYYLLSDESNYVSEMSHRTMNGIARNTARSDLEGLYSKGLLEKILEGRRIKYYAAKKLKKLALH
jgi:Fic family protein